MMRRILALSICVVFAACADDSTTPSVGDEEFALPADGLAEGVEHRITKAGVVTGILNADTAYIHENGRRYDLFGVRVTFNTEQGVPNGTLTSETADYNTAEGIFIARRNVVLLIPGPEGERRLETEELHYEITRDQIYTLNDFVLHEAGRVTRGTSFRTDSKFRLWEVTGVETSGTVSEGGTAF
jgi:LPS export ABC transporter protein LptC